MRSNLLIIIGLVAAACANPVLSYPESSDDAYWMHILRAAKAHPSYGVYLSRKSAVSSLLSIEQARRYPKVEGIFSRTDGSSSLTTTPSAWQAGVAVSYPLFENYRQDARDLIAISQGQQELAVSAQDIESLIADLANTHIRIWEARESIKVLDDAANYLKILKARVAEQVGAGETSRLVQSKLNNMDLDVQAKRLDAEQRLELASKIWAVTKITVPDSVLLPSAFNSEEALSANAKLQRLESELARVEGEYDLSKRDEGPTVTLQVSVLNRKYESQSGWPSYNTWQVNATYPMFDGGLAKARTQREALNLIGKSAELDAERQKTDIEIQGLRAGLKSASMIVTAKEAQCQLQRQIAESTRVRFDLGRGTLTEVTESFLSANDCLLMTLHSRMDYFTRYHELKRLDGTLVRLISEAEK